MLNVPAFVSMEAQVKILEYYLSLVHQKIGHISLLKLGGPTKLLDLLRRVSRIYDRLEPASHKLYNP